MSGLLGQQQCQADDSPGVHRGPRGVAAHRGWAGSQRPACRRRVGDAGTVPWTGRFTGSCCRCACWWRAWRCSAASAGRPCSPRCLIGFPLLGVPRLTIVEAIGTSLLLETYRFGAGAVTLPLGTLGAVAARHTPASALRIGYGVAMAGFTLLLARKPPGGSAAEGPVSPALVSQSDRSHPPCGHDQASQLRAGQRRPPSIREPLDRLTAELEHPGETIVATKFRWPDDLRAQQLRKHARGVSICRSAPRERSSACSTSAVR